MWQQFCKSIIQPKNIKYCYLKLYWIHALESQRKGSDTLSLQSQAVNEERMWSSRWVHGWQGNPKPHNYYISYPWDRWSDDV